MVKSIVLLGLFLLTLFSTQMIAVSSSSSSRRLQQGIEFYQSQRYSDAVEVWNTALNRDYQSDSVLDEALTLHYLSLAYQQQGNWEKARQSITQSLQRLESTSPSPLATEILAKALNTQGRLQYLQGKPETAYKTWQHSAQLYDRIGDSHGQLMTQLNQTQALQAQGLSLQAKQHLQTLRETFPQDATTLRYLGVALGKVGDLAAALATLEESLIYQETPETWLALANVEVKLGKVAWFRSNFSDAYDYFYTANQHYTQANTLLSAQLNQLRLNLEIGNWEEGMKQLPSILSHLETLSLSGEKFSSYYHLAESLICLKTVCAQFWEEAPQKIENAPSWKEIAIITRQGLTQAQQLKDIKGESYGLGVLGNIYEQTQQWEDAKTLTQQADLILSAVDAPEIAYRWEWQLGRIEGKLGNIDSGKSAYESAVVSLETVRGDLVSVETDVSFSFQKNVEPLYREYVGLLLQGNESEKDLKKSIEVLNNLQLAELENYLRCSLRSRVDLTQNLETIDPNAAYLYSILLPQQLVVIAQLPQQPLKLYRQTIPEETVTTTLQQLQTGILRRRIDLTRNSGKQLYEWLLSSVVTDLESDPNLKTLVFTLDPKLRNLSLPALYDEQQEEYLIDKPYAIALTPNSQLFPLDETRSRSVNVLAGGISDSLQIGRRTFSPLKAAEELSQLETLTDSLILLDRAFTPNRLENTFSREAFSVIHFATHAQFSSNPEETYILAYDETGAGRLLDIDRLSALLQRLQQQGDDQPLDLFVLSACETAKGDERALLGLAGVAIQSGAQSTLATQWKVSDDSTVTLMTQFYQQLAQDMSKAEALQQAQQALKNNPNTQNPFFWGGYVLIGNWK